MLVDLPEELEQAISLLFTSGDSFFDELDEEKADEFGGTVQTLKGLIRSNEFPKICNSLRFFTKLNAESKVENAKMPTTLKKEVMRPAAESFDKSVRVILSKIAEEIESSLSLKQDALSKLFGHSMINLSRYTPTTQQVLKSMFENKSLVLTQDKQAALQFIPHEDLPMFTVIAYRDHTCGLQVLRKSSGAEYQDIDASFEKPALLLFTGKELTQIIGFDSLPHRVIVTPALAQSEAQKPSNEWRFTISAHYFYNSEKTNGMIVPIVDTKKSTKSEHSIPYQTFFDDYIATGINYEEPPAEELPAELLEKFPTSVVDQEHYDSQFNVGYSRK